MYRLPIECRITHRYNVGWAHLDRFEPIGSLNFTPQRETSCSYDGDVARVTQARLPLAFLEAARKVWREHADKHEGRRVPFKRWLGWQIGDSFDSGCRCEHDCCGHYQYRGSARIEGRRVFVLVTACRNV